MEPGFPEKQALCRRRYHSVDEKIDVGADRETNSSCLPEGRGVDHYVLAAPVAAPKEPAYWGTPLDADRISRLFVEEPSSSPRPKAIETTFEDPKARYQVKIDIPEGYYTQHELDEIRRTIFTLNRFLKEPVKTFGCRLSDEPDASSLYSKTNNGIELSHQPGSLRGRRVESTICDVTHEMGHALQLQRHPHDPLWEQVYLRSLAGRNYEIIDDSNYAIDVSDDYGHPFANHHEAFASAFHAYYQHADEMAVFLQNPETPETMRTFGKLVWCYLRERVFHGRVFTPNKADPFATENFSSLLRAMPGDRMDFLRSAYEQDQDPHVRLAVVERLGEIGPSEAEISVPILIDALQDNEAVVRLYAIRALLKMDGAAKDAVPVLRKISLHDPDEGLRKKAKESLAQIYFAYR